MKTVFVDVDGIDTRCLIGGNQNGRPVVLIHGLTLIADIWNAHAAGMESGDFYVVAPDMAGSGFTGTPVADGRPMIAYKVEHLCKLVDRLGIDSFCVSGSSYGALIGALVYLKLGRRVERLIINGSGTCFNTPEEISIGMERTFASTRPTLGDSTREEWCRRVRQSFYSPTLAPPDLVALLMTCYARQAAVSAWERTIGDLRDPLIFRPYSILSRLPEFKVRTLVAWGRQDAGAPYANAVNAITRLPNAELVTFEDCGHMPMIEYPELYNRAVLSFLDDWHPPHRDFGKSASASAAVPDAA